MSSPRDDAESVVVRLLTEEVPEIATGVVEIRAVARTPGLRTKVAVATNDRTVDPIGACVGLQATRIKRITMALDGEPVDVVRWSESAERRIRNALAPVNVRGVVLDAGERRAQVVVAQREYARAMGEGGALRDLAGRFAGWQLDLRPDDDAA